MSDLERPWFQRVWADAPASCPVCGAASRWTEDGSVLTCRRDGVEHFEWRPDAPPVVSVSSERADRPDAIPARSLFVADLDHGSTSDADNQRYDNSLTMPLPQARPEGYSCTHTPRCRDWRDVGDPEWTATEMACGRVEVEGPDDDFAETDFGEFYEALQPIGPLDAIVRDVKRRMDEADHRPPPDVWDGHFGRVDNDAPPLTPDEVAELADGTPITVIWAGGNGPHDYVVSVNDHGTRCAWKDDGEERLRFYNPLRFVGQERFHTRVWLREVPAAAVIAGELLGRDFVETAERRLHPDAATLASLHRPVYGRPPYCWSCSSGGGQRTRVDSSRRAPWPCSTASLALEMMGLTPSDIAITEE